VVRVYFGNFQPWDHHDDILIHRTLARQSDRPMAVPIKIKDLKALGLFQGTLVIVGREFGRTPSVENSASVKVQKGRDHDRTASPCCWRALA
jgi:hypothetical protein